MTSIHALVKGVVDYAGLFPPAALPLSEVVRNYADYIVDNRLQMLGRLVIPAGRLKDLEQETATLPPSQQHWRISALAAAPADADSAAFLESMNAIEDFNQRQKEAGGQTSQVDVIEVKSGSPSTTVIIHERLPKGIQAFLEFDWRTDPAENLAAVAGLNSDQLFAKIRTGGVTENLIPSSELVGRFVSNCAKHGVGFKATAGLHHPLRGEYRLTYEPDANAGTMHGFFNVFLAGCFAFLDPERPIKELIDMLECRSATEIQISDSTINFGGREINLTDIKRVRDQSVISFGSCSFEEPTTELAQLFC